MEIFIAYVDPTATTGTGGGGGGSWADAYLTLQDAINGPSTSQIRVAQGTYYPDEGSGQADDARGSTFTLISGVEIYGGFPTGGGDGSFGARNSATYPTMLSGDLDQNDNSGGDNSGNAYHVLTANGVDASTILDGFTITAGNAPIGNPTGSVGGGLYCSFSSLLITNVSFQGNSSNSRAGALDGFNCSSSFTNVSFQGNSAAGNGDAIFIDNGSPNFINTIFWNNAASGVTDTASASVLESGFGSIYSHCLVQNIDLSGSNGNLDGTDSANAPLFVLEVDPATAPTIGGDLRLLTSSPALDSGDDSANSEPADLAGNPRKVGTIDLGAYEGNTDATFALLNPTLDPNGDDNSNGITNYGDYAAGGDPSAPNDPTLRPLLSEDYFTFSFRNNASDVFSVAKTSTTLLPNSWIGFGGSPIFQSIIGGRTTTLQHNFDPVATADEFYRVECTTAP